MTPICELDVRRNVTLETQSTRRNTRYHTWLAWVRLKNLWYYCECILILPAPLAPRVYTFSWAWQYSPHHDYAVVVRFQGFVMVLHEKLSRL